MIAADAQDRGGGGRGSTRHAHAPSDKHPHAPSDKHAQPPLHRCPRNPATTIFQRRHPAPHLFGVRLRHLSQVNNTDLPPSHLELGEVNVRARARPRRSVTPNCYGRLEIRHFSNVPYKHYLGTVRTSATATAARTTCLRERASSLGGLGFRYSRTPRRASAVGISAALRWTMTRQTGCTRLHCIAEAFAHHGDTEDRYFGLIRLSQPGTNHRITGSNIKQVEVSSDSFARPPLPDRPNQCRQPH